jgi:hypothetical protein
MTRHLIPKSPSATALTSLRSPTSDTETAPTVLDLDRRLQFAQRLAVLIRRIQIQPRVRAKEEPSDES